MMGQSGQSVAELCGQWVARHPLFVAALWIVVMQLLGAWAGWALWLALPVALAVGLWLRRPWLAAAWLICMSLAEGVGNLREVQARERALELSQAATAIHGGKLLAEARGDENFWQAPVRLSEGCPGAGARVWWQGRGPMPVEGSRVRASGRFEWPPAVRNPGAFDRREWLNRQAIHVVFEPQAHGSTQVNTPGGWKALADLRCGVRSAITRGIEDESTAAKVIRAVVLGDKPRKDDELLDDFRHSGSMHVFSVSGLHVGMVAVLVWMIAACSGVSRRWLVLPVIVVVFAYVWVTGANAPAIRAAWMAAVFLGAFCWRRRPDLPNALGAVLLVLLLWDVRQIHQVGVQLSYGVVTAIAFGLPWTTRWFRAVGAPPMLMPVAEIKGLRLVWWRSRQWLATTLAVSCAAGMGAAPLTLWHFGLVTPISVVAALLLLPLVFAIMVLALVSILLSPMEMVSGPLMTASNRANGLIAESCASLAGVMAEVPGGHWQGGREHGPLLLVYDLKHGDGAACWLPERKSAGVLIDCGGSHSANYPVRASLKQLGIEVDSIVLTHPDGGHVGGGHPLWIDLPIRQALLPVERARSPAYRAWLEKAPAEGVTLLQASALEGLPVGEDARIEWLHLPDAGDANLAADHRVLVMRLHWRGWKILWHSDAGNLAEQAMLESGRDLGADVIVAGRHRTDLCLSETFMEAVDPRVIIIGNDAHPEGERVSSDKLEQWRRSGIIVFDQSRCGAVLVRPEDGGLTIEGHIDGQKVRLK